MRSMIVVASALCAAPLVAQLEDSYLPFVTAEKAFDEAARTGKRLLVYQDWAG